MIFWCWWWWQYRYCSDILVWWNYWWSCWRLFVSTLYSSIIDDDDDNDILLVLLFWYYYYWPDQCLCVAFVKIPGVLMILFILLPMEKIVDVWSTNDDDDGKLTIVAAWWHILASSSSPNLIRIVFDDLCEVLTKTYYSMKAPTPNPISYSCC